MRIVSFINQHLPIWSMLDGDHALKQKTNLINPKLIENPDFLSPVENGLRFEIFKTQRNWIAKKMGDRVSFALIKFSYTDLRDFYTCFKDITFKQYANEYSRSYRDGDYFKIGELTKSDNDVDDQMSLVKKVKNDYFTVYADDVLNHECNNKTLAYAMNRSIIMKNDGKYYVLDGTHRLTAYYLAARQSEFVPSELYGFCFERTYE
jgi:hypothetical protein